MSPLWLTLWAVHSASFQLNLSFILATLRFFFQHLHSCLLLLIQCSIPLPLAITIPTPFIFPIATFITVALCRLHSSSPLMRRLSSSPHPPSQISHNFEQIIRHLSILLLQRQFSHPPFARVTIRSMVELFQTLITLTHFSA
ncbi:hypothetical protein BLNAU_10108 [Blattamonas nauphoetae]|uniref:Uncharacterized protein n=1 Tax=Blattamonas nauphoetae TaxID=2049346 RepID=A0ABQ9XU09_9EUKA|nr:hypothetical protein BLNAU_10108 [Blattamonas nauphoetae]